MDTCSLFVLSLPKTATVMSNSVKPKSGFLMKDKNDTDNDSKDSDTKNNNDMKNNATKNNNDIMDDDDMKNNNGTKENDTKDNYDTKENNDTKDNNVTKNNNQNDSMCIDNSDKNSKNETKSPKKLIVPIRITRIVPMPNNEILGVQRLKKKIHDANLPSHAIEKVKPLLDMVGIMNPSTMEYVNVVRYLEVLASLPWNKVAYSDHRSLVESRKILTKHHYAMDNVVERIVEQLAVQQVTSGRQGSILCLVGPPGTGKTSIASAIAEVLGRPFVRVALGGVMDVADIRGHRRTYVNSMPGRIMTAISKVKVKNPVMLLDEIDKLSDRGGMASSGRGAPASALLELLDPEQNHSFTDHYLDVPFDLSQVVFLCTANTVATIDPPLLDRCEVINILGYSLEEKLRMSSLHLLPKVMKRHGLSPELLHIPDDVVHTIIEEYTDEAGVRELVRDLSAICRHVTYNLVAQYEKKQLLEGLKPKEKSEVYEDWLEAEGSGVQPENDTELIQENMKLLQRKLEKLHEDLMEQNRDLEEQQRAVVEPQAASTEQKEDQKKKRQSVLQELKAHFDLLQGELKVLERAQCENEQGVPASCPPSLFDQLRGLQSLEELMCNVVKLPVVITREDLRLILGPSSNLLMLPLEVGSVPGVMHGLAVNDKNHGVVLSVEAALGPACKPYKIRDEEPSDVASTSNEVSSDVATYNVIQSVTLTGNAGLHFKESVSVAVAWINRNAHKLRLFPPPASRSLHVHLPIVAVSKDGPSAGVAVTCAVLSALLGRPVMEGVAATGELSLTGLVLPIGGLKAKLLAAHRCGIKKVVAPIANETYLSGLPAGVLDKTHLVFVRTIEEAIGHVFEPCKELQQFQLKSKL